MTGKGHKTKRCLLPVDSLSNLYITFSFIITVLFAMQTMFASWAVRFGVNKILDLLLPISYLYLRQGAAFDEAFAVCEEANFQALIIMNA